MYGVSLRVLGYLTCFLREGVLGRLSVRSPPAFADEETAALVVVNGGKPGFAGYDAPRAVPLTVACARRFPHFALCSLCNAAGLSFSASRRVWTRRTVSTCSLGRCSHARYGVRQRWLPVVVKGRGGPAPSGRGRGGGVAGSLTPR